MIISRTILDVRPCRSFGGRYPCLVVERVKQERGMRCGANGSAGPISVEHTPRVIEVVWTVVETDAAGLERGEQWTFRTKKGAMEHFQRKVKSREQVEQAGFLAKTVRWRYRGQLFDSAVEPAPCGLCGRRAMIALPATILAEQPDDTTHVCHPLAGGCNHGFSNVPARIDEASESETSMNEPKCSERSERNPACPGLGRGTAGRGAA